MAKRLTPEEKLERNERIQAERDEIVERRSSASPKIVGLNELLFPVEIRDEDLESNSECSKRIIGIGIGQNGTDKLLNQCSPRYELVPNSTIFPQIEEVLNSNGIEFKPEYKHIQNVRFYGDYQINDSRYGYKMKGTNDIIQPMLRVQHSYNGLTKYRIVFGYFRLVCSNGLVIPVKEMQEFNLVIVGKHTESILHSFDKLNSMLQMFSWNAKEITSAITKNYNILGDRWVKNPKDRLIEVMNANKIAIIESSKYNTVNDIMGKIMSEADGSKKVNVNGVEVDMGYDGKVNDWLIWQGINQYLNDDKRNIAAPEKRMETDSAVFQYMLEYA